MEEDFFFQNTESARWKRWNDNMNDDSSKDGYDYESVSFDQDFYSDIGNQSSQIPLQQILNLLKSYSQGPGIMTEPNTEIFRYLFHQSSFIEHDKLKRGYQRFLEKFQEFWNVIYDVICKEEIRNLRKNNYQNVADDILSFSYSDFYNENKIWGNIRLSEFVSMFQDLSSICSFRECNLIFDQHLKLMTSLNFMELEIDYTLEKNRIFYFFSVSRLNLLYQKYLQKIQYDILREGELYINQEELKQYILEQLMTYNQYAKNERRQHKYFH